MTASIVLGQPVMKKGLSKLDLAILALATIFTICLVLPLFMNGLHATAGAAGDGQIRTLTDVFSTKSFRGSANALSKASFIGMALSNIISWFSFLGLCLTLYQKFITLLYLSSRNLFDAVYDVKMTKMSGKALGYGGLFEALFKNGENGGKMGGGGLDIFITFVYSLLPNIKAYCDYSPESALIRTGKIEEDTDVTGYMLKTALPTICLIFFLTIGYSGTLAKAYGVIVDGLAVAADYAVEQNLAGFVKQQLNGMGSYQWTIGQLNAEQAKYTESVAQGVWGQVMGRVGNADEMFKKNLGKILENTMYGVVEGSSLVAGQDYVVAKFHPATVANGEESAVGTASSGILGGNHAMDSNPILNCLINANLPIASRDKHEVFNPKSDADYEHLKSPYITISSSETSIGKNAIVYSMDEIVKAALGGSTEQSLDDLGLRETNLFVHVHTEVNVNRGSSYLVPDPKRFDYNGNEQKDLTDEGEQNPVK